MAQVAVAQTSFDRIVRDVARNRLPQGACWNLQDYIPNEIDAPLAKRGGWAYASQDLTVALAGADRVNSVIYAPFFAGGQLVGIANDNNTTYRCVQINSAVSTTDRGGTGIGQDDYFPVFYRNKVYFATGGTVLVYNGTSNIAALSSLGDAPPSDPTWPVAYKDRLVLARTTSEPQRVYFAEAGDPTSWDLTNRYIDASQEITGMWALRNMLLLWEKTKMERIIGSIPPPGTDMYLQPVYEMGLGNRDCYSLAGTDDFVCFANATGAYMTDGSAVIDLTDKGGIKSLWQEQTSSVGDNIRYAGGYFRGWYFVSLWNTNLTSVACWMCKIIERPPRWIRLTNIPARWFARKIQGGVEELFFADFTAPRVNSLTSIFTPSSTYKNDANGTAVTPVLETPYYEVGLSKSRVRRAYLIHDVRDSASDNPTLSLSSVTSPESTSYTTATPSSTAETSELSTTRFGINKASYGVGLKVTQTNASATTRISKVGIEGHPRESSRV